MNDDMSRAAHPHARRAPRGVALDHREDADRLFAVDDAARTRPVSIVAERRLGETDLALYPFALGTGRLAVVDEDAAARVLQRFAARGGALYDVVDEDGSGRSQQIVGAWLQANRPAKVVTVLTPSPERDGGRATGGARIVRSVEAALRRLRLDHIDLLTLDLRGQDLTLDQRLGAVDELVAAGKIRFAGADGVTGAGLIEARVLAGDGLARIVAVRAGWDVTSRPSELAELRMIAAAQQLGILPDATPLTLALTRPSLPQKVLAGWTRGARPDRPSDSDEPRAATRGCQRATEVLAGRGREHRIALALDRVSAELGIAPAMTQLAWLLAKRGVVAPVVHVTRPEQIDPLMDSAAVRLTRAEMLELDRAVEAQR
ncbi:MAG: aldo/keto reductase [Microbacteriaceae bacterium]|nr:aldo/keto reductase [Microbacteriaceae bacterium]